MHVYVNLINSQKILKNAIGFRLQPCGFGNTPKLSSSMTLLIVLYILFVAATWGEKMVCLSTVTATRLGFKRNTVECRDSRIEKQPIEVPQMW